MVNRYIIFSTHLLPLNLLDCQMSKYPYRTQKSWNYLGMAINYRWKKLYNIVHWCFIHLFSFPSDKIAFGWFCWKCIVRIIDDQTEVWLVKTLTWIKRLQKLKNLLRFLCPVLLIFLGSWLILRLSKLVCLSLSIIPPSLILSNKTWTDIH